MKKTYITPAMSAVEFKAKPMLNITSIGDGKLNAGGNKGDFNNSSYTILTKERRGIFQDGDNVEENQSIW